MRDGGSGRQSVVETKPQVRVMRTAHCIAENANLPTFKGKLPRRRATPGIQLGLCRTSAADSGGDLILSRLEASLKEAGMLLPQFSPSGGEHES